MSINLVVCYLAPGVPQRGKNSWGNGSSKEKVEMSKKNMRAPHDLNGKIHGGS